MKTSRRTVLASALAAALISRGGNAEKLGKIEDDSALGRIPALPGSQADWPASILTWADIAGYCAAAGIDRPAAFSDDTVKNWTEIGQRIPVNDNVLFLYMNQPWQQIAGFSPWDVDQVAVAFDPPAQLRVYSGAFDPDRVAKAFGHWDFASSSAGDFQILASPDDGLDLSRDLDQFTLGNFNHVAVSETLLLASRSAEMLGAAIDVATKAAETIVDSDLFGDVAKAIDGMHGFVLLNGSLLGSPIVNPGTLEDSETIPPAQLFLGGIAADKDRHVTSLITDLGDPAAAEAAVPIVQERIETLTSPISQRAYTDDLAGFEVDFVEGTGLVRVIVPNDTFAMRWMKYIFAGDLLFLATQTP